MRKIALFVILCFFCLTGSFSSRVLSAAEQTFPFTGQTRDNDVNIRTDSTVGSAVICTVDKGVRLEVVGENYDWYKVRLPRQAPSFVKKDLAECMQEKAGEALGADLTAKNTDRCSNAKITGSRVNVRLGPSETSPILGKVDENEMIAIVSETNDWFKIIPIQNSFGWIHKNFIKKAPVVAETVKPKIEIKESPKPGESVVIEGTVRPYGKFFKRSATHNLLTDDEEIFLLKGDKATLDAVNHRRAKITGTIIAASSQKYPTLDVKVVEVVD